MITNLNIDAISDASIPDSKLQERYVLSTTPPNDEIWYTTTDGNVVSFNSTSCGANVVSNTYVNGKGVIKFDGKINAIRDEAFDGCSSLTSITIPDSVTFIGPFVFHNCTSLTSVTIPNSVTEFGSFAFQNCTSLTSVTIPDRMTSISSSVFSGCTSLTSVTIPDSVTSIGHHAFDGCSSLTSITIPNSVTSIANQVFQGCTSLTSITIPDNVTEIGSLAFSGCGGELIINSKIIETNYFDDNYPSLNGWLKGAEFTKLTIGDSVTSIGRQAFEYCESLTSVTIPDSVTTIGDEAFEYCTSLTSVTIPDSVTTIGDHAFAGCDSLTSVTIGDSVTTIGEYAFAGCDSLTSITIGNSVTTIDDFAFSDCSSLTSVTIPDGVTAIGYRAFEDCTSLKSITIPDSVTSIGKMAFNNCTGELIINNKIVENNYTIDDYPYGDGMFQPLSTDGWLIGVKFTKLTIGDSVTSIGDYVFCRCSSLKSITIPNSVTSIGGGALYGTSLTSVTIPDSVTTIGSSVFESCTSLTSVTIPDSVTTIGDNAFFYCRNLTSVTIPNSVTTIGNYAFRECTSLINVTIGNRVATIGDNAFYLCKSLKSVTIPDSVTTIGEYAFYHCDSLTSVTIGDGVTSIGQSAFNYCSELTDITFGRGVTEIGSGAFSTCDNLTTVYCKPTTPPILSDASLIKLGRTYYVPMDSVDAYKTATNWSEYVDIIGCVFEDENLVSGENIKTINGRSILGEGNIELNIELGSKNFPSDDELWYISASNSIQYAYEGAFGDSQVVSHTYENGIGVIKFNKTLTEITGDVFRENGRVTSVYIPEKVTSIGQDAFGSLILTDVFMGSKTAPELYDANVFGNWDAVVNSLKIWIPGEYDSYMRNEEWHYYWESFRPYIKGGENLISGKNIATINGAYIIGDHNFNLVSKSYDGYVDESLTPSYASLSLGSGLKPWNTVYANSVYAYGEFLINTNTNDWSLGTPTEGNDLCNISGGGGDMSLNSKDITIAGKNAVNIVVGDEDISQGKINVTPGAVSVDGYFYCSDNFEVNTNSECYATAFYETSDENLKDFSDDITVDFNKLKEIRKSYFTWKDGDQNLHIGTSAQDIQKVYPELISEDNKGNLTVDYAKLSIIALSAIDKLDERLSRIENILNKEE